MKKKMDKLSYKEKLRKLPGIKFAKNNKKQLLYYFDEYKTHHIKVLSGGMYTSDHIVINFFEKFSKDGYINMIDIINAFKKIEFHDHREMLPAALLTMCLRARCPNYVWAVGLNKEEDSHIDFYIAYRSFDDNKQDILSFQQCEIPDNLKKNNKKIDQVIEKATEIIRKKLFDRYPKFEKPLNLFIFSQLSFSNTAKNNIYNILLEDFKKQKIFKEIWFLYCNGIVDNDLEFGAEKVLLNGKVAVNRILINSELEKYVLRKDYK